MRSVLGVGGLALALSFLTGCDGTLSAALPEAGRVDPPAAGVLVYEQIIDGNKDLYAIPTGGGQPLRLTTHAGSDGLARWTRDGKAVIYTTDRSGNWQLWKVPAEGGESTRVRENAHTEWQADQSPDLRQLAFLSNREGPEFLWLMDLATGKLRSLVEHGNRTIMGNPQWSPDGKRIVFSSNYRIGHQIYVVDVASGEVKRISPAARGGCEPRFHPDGKRVVYVSRRHLKTTSELVEHHLETDEVKVLVDWPALNYDPVYSPDGSELAFASNITGDYVVYRQRFSDGRAFRVTHDPGEARYPDYRPQAAE